MHHAIGIGGYAGVGVAGRVGACPALRPCSGSHSRPPLHCQVSASDVRHHRPAVALEARRLRHRAEGHGASAFPPEAHGLDIVRRDPRKPPTPANRSLPGRHPRSSRRRRGPGRGPCRCPQCFRLGPICRTLECPTGAVSGFSLLAPPLTCRGTDPDCAVRIEDITRTVRQDETRTNQEHIKDDAREDFGGWLTIVGSASATGCLTHG